MWGHISTNADTGGDGKRLLKQKGRWRGNKAASLRG